MTPEYVRARSKYDEALRRYRQEARVYGPGHVARWVRRAAEQAYAEMIRVGSQ